jgi:predicted aminopeptidase
MTLKTFPTPPPSGSTRRITFRRALILILSLLSVLAIFFGITGCGLGYLFHAAKGQYRLMSGTVPVSEALRSAALTPEERENLLLVARVKEFGQRNLGLTPTENYTTVYLKPKENPIHTVSASPKDRLSSVTWCFPVVGCMPYIGFFDLGSANGEAKKLEQQGYDISIGRAGAYSTLGWFKDPVTRDMLKGSTVKLVDTLLHEMTHTTIYMKGQGDFNEGMAMLVGLHGAAAFFESVYGPEDPASVQARRAIEDQRLFSSFLGSLVIELEMLYDSPLTYAEKLEQREKIFQKAKQDFKGLKEDFQTKRFDFFARTDLNNATIRALSVYHAHFNLFEDILTLKGGSIKETIALFHDLSKGSDRLIAAGRSWLRGERFNAVSASKEVAEEARGEPLDENQTTL